LEKFIRMKPEETIDFHIRWAWYKISRYYNNVASKHNISMSIGYVLLNIDKQTGTPSTQLATMMGMEQTSIARTLKNMEEEGLIVKKSDAYDKRIIRIYMTEKGKMAREISKGTVIAFNEKIRNSLTNEELQHFFSIMNKINQFNEEIP
jgi:DNA-binding MarR family transcriptional regulator